MVRLDLSNTERLSTVDKIFQEMHVARGYIELGLIDKALDVLSSEKMNRHLDELNREADRNFVITPLDLLEDLQELVAST